MKKTLLISEIFPPVHGGSGRWFWELYSRLPKDEYFIAAGSNKNVDTISFDKTLQLNLKRFNLSSTSWGIRSLTGLKLYWRTFWQLRKHIKQNKITHIHCGRCIPEGFMGYMLSKVLRLPLLCYVHGEDVEAAATSRELSWIVNKVLAHSQTIICNSQNTSSILMNNWLISESKIKTLNPGVDTNIFVPAEQSTLIRKNLGWESRPVVLTVGRLQKRKGQDMMIKALPQIKQKIPNILYALVGGGEELYSLTELVSKLNLTDNVMFMAEINDQTMLDCYQQCDLFILPNRTVEQDIEGFGMVLVEAQSCEKVVVAGDSGGTSETMVLNETGFIIDCTSPAPIAEMVTNLLMKPELRHKMGKKARIHVTATLDWKVHAEKAKHVFSNSLDNK